MRRIKLFVKSTVYSFSLIYRSSKMMILLYFALNLVCTAAPLLSALVLKYLLDFLTVGMQGMPMLMLCLGAYVAMLVLLQAMRSAGAVLEDSIFKKAGHLYDCEISEKLAALPMSVLDTSEGRDMVDDVRYTKNTVIFLVMYQMVPVLSSLYTFGAAFATLATFHIWFSLLFLVLTVPGIILNVIFGHMAEDLRRKTAPDVRRFCYYRWMLTDAWPAKDVRMYDLTEPIRERYDSEKTKYRKANKELDKKKLSAALFAELILRSGEIIFTVYVVLQALRGEISIGDVALYIGFALTVCSSFQRMTVAMEWFGRCMRINGVMDRLFEFLAIPCPEESRGKRELDSFESLTFDKVYFKYPMTDKYILTGVSFTLNRGDKLSIVGINGSGKSTVIKLMLGLYEVESGQILINGYPMADYDRKDINRLFSVLFQSFVQYPLTLRDNIALSDYDRMQNDEEMNEALKQSSVYDELQPKLESGLDSWMTRQFDDKGTELSKGQWQKIALARAYFKKAPIVIFDEPSAALDAEAEDRIFKNFEKISGDKTGIMISHRISAARMSNKIIVLDEGKIAESGTHEELLELGGLYARLYNLQKEKYAMKEVEQYG